MSAITETTKIGQQRQLVIAEAATWENTPFRWHACVKGPHGGCDCGQLLKASFAAIGLDVVMPSYSTQFFMHRNDELYLRELDKYCIQVSSPQPGDIVAFQMGRAYGHAGIVIKWPRIIHAHGLALAVQIRNAVTDPDFGWRAKLFYSLKQWHQ